MNTQIDLNHIRGALHLLETRTRPEPSEVDAMAVIKEKFRAILQEGEKEMIHQEAKPKKVKSEGTLVPKKRGRKPANKANGQSVAAA